MKLLLIFAFFFFTSFSYGQQNDPVSTMDFIQIIDNNKEEAIHYYKNNWKVLRENAIKKEYILSYQLLEVQASVDAPFEIILVTTYIDNDQYSARKSHFSELKQEGRKLNLLNDKKPEEFRKILFSKDPVKHLF